MTSRPDTQQARDLGELRNHLKWLDEERRKASRKVADVEQRLAQQGRDLAERDRKIEALERQIAAQAAHFERLPDLASNALQVEKRLNDLESRLADLNAQFVGRPAPEEERARLSAEIEQTVAHIMSEYGQEATARQLELEARLQAGLASRLESEILQPLTSRLDEQSQIIAHQEGVIDGLSEKIDALATQMSEQQDSRATQSTDLFTALSDELMRTEASVKAWTSDQLELREMVTGMVGSVNRDQTELEQKLASWQAMLDEHKDLVDQLSQQWLSLSNQYKEARMAVQNFANWQKQLEQQKRESTQLVRLEANRLQARWDAMAQELQERFGEFEADQAQKWHAFELENGQRWAATRQTEQAWREQLAGLENLMRKGQLDSRNLILRVQAAQMDAIKRWPLLLSEEVEKAVEQNTRRLVASAAADPHSSLSVIDAIERGLITIDYASEADADS